MCLSLMLQRKDGEKLVDCRAPNAKEIQNFLENCSTKLSAKLQLPGRPTTAEKPLPFGWVPEFSMDNASVHKAAYAVVDWPNKPAWSKEGFGKVQPPPYSPDFHKVIEHVHAILCPAAMREIEAMPVPDNDKPILTYFKVRFAVAGPCPSSRVSPRLLAGA